MRKQSQEDQLLGLLRQGPKTTNEIIGSPFLLAAAYRRAISELRNRGHKIAYHKRPRGTGYYTLDFDSERVLQQELFST